MPYLWPLPDHILGPVIRCSATWRFTGSEHCAAPQRFTLLALLHLPSETRVQPLKHVAGRPYYTTQGSGVHPRGCRIRQRVLLQWMQLLPGGSVALIRSCGCVGLKEQRRVGSGISTTPPLFWLFRPPLFLSSPPWLKSQRGQQGWVVTMLITPAVDLKHREACEAWERPKKSVFHSSVALYYATFFCLIVSWHGNGRSS